MAMRRLPPIVLRGDVMGPVKPRQEPKVIPLGSPSRAELWARHQLALSVLAQRGATAETAALIGRILRGETIEVLAGDR